jgi:hypothetical protein
MMTLGNGGVATPGLSTRAMLPRLGFVGLGFAGDRKSRIFSAD